MLGVSDVSLIVFVFSCLRHSDAKDIEGLVQRVQGLAHLFMPRSVERCQFTFCDASFGHSLLMSVGCAAGVVQS